MRSIEDVVEDVKAIDDSTVGMALQLLREYGSMVSDYIAEISAELCRVDVDDMLGDTRDIDNVRARWFYWYSYRYMTEESYEKMSSLLNRGRQYDRATIGQGVAKICLLIGDDGIWRRRWAVMRKVIGIVTGDTDAEIGCRKCKVTVTYPEGVDIELKKE